MAREIPALTVKRFTDRRVGTLILTVDRMHAGAVQGVTVAKMTEAGEKLVNPNTLAAAGELLEELKALVAYCRTYHDTVDISDFLFRSETAIEKAENPLF